MQDTPNTITWKFSDLVTIRKATQCATCETYDYVIKYTIAPTIAPYLSLFGQLKYPLEHFKIIQIDNDQVYLSGHIGQTTIKVKYKQNIEAIKLAFQGQLAAYLAAEHNIHVVIA